MDCVSKVIAWQVTLSNSHFNGSAIGELVGLNIETLGSVTVRVNSGVEKGRLPKDGWNGEQQGKDGIHDDFGGFEYKEVKYELFSDDSAQYIYAEGPPYGPMKAVSCQRGSVNLWGTPGQNDRPYRSGNMRC